MREDDLVFSVVSFMFDLPWKKEKRRRKDTNVSLVSPVTRRLVLLVALVPVTSTSERGNFLINYN